MIKRKVYRTFDDPFIVHFYEVAFANLLIFGYHMLTVGAANFQNMTAADFFAMGVSENFHHAPQSGLCVHLSMLIIASDVGFGNLYFCIAAIAGNLRDLPLNERYRTGAH